MFSFFARKQHVDIAGYLRRICDRTAPNSGLTDELTRTENRYNRTLPVMLWLWEEDQPEADDFCVAVSKDITDHGIGIVLTAPLSNQDVVVALPSWEAEQVEPWFFLGRSVRSKPIGGGYWTVGVELVEFLNKDRPETVECLVSQATRTLAVTDSR